MTDPYQHDSGGIIQFIAGGALGLIGLYFVLAFPAISVAMGHAPGIDWVTVCGVIIVVSCGIFLRLAIRPGGVFKPFLLGLMAGLCCAALLQGFCFWKNLGGS